MIDNNEIVSNGAIFYLRKVYMEFKQDLKKIATTMIPVLIAQLSMVGMNFMDSTMSGHVSADDLAGVAVGAGLFMPVLTCSLGILSASTPIIAQLVGKKENEKIPYVVRTGILLGIIIALIFATAYVLFIDNIMNALALTPPVEKIARMYLLAMVIAVFFQAPLISIRALTDTVQGTALSMKLFLTALPVNGLLNYLFIFGAFGMEGYGGVGAGIATAITYMLVLGMFLFVIRQDPVFQSKKIFSGLKTYIRDWKEYCEIGIPNGLGIFMETSLFGFLIIFMAKFGTVAIGSYQAALNFSNLIYTIPLSCSIAMTILIGVEVGAGRYKKAKKYGRCGIALTLAIAVITLISTIAFRSYIARLYSNEAEVLELVAQFLVYCACWQMFDAVAAPIQGILRGYKDVKIPFIMMVIAYWCVCLPVGLIMDHVFNHGPFAYWQGLVSGVGASATLLTARLIYLERKYGKFKSIN